MTKKKVNGTGEHNQSPNKRDQVSRTLLDAKKLTTKKEKMQLTIKERVEGSR
jgi:hypothetical protein